MRDYLRSSTEFQKVYRHGQRYDGRLITVFVIENRSGRHRLGVTASRKAVGNAVNRNRAKRLIRESFEFNGRSLRSLSSYYDWVINAKARLVSEKLVGPAKELAEIIEKVGKVETTRSVEVFQ